MQDDCANFPRSEIEIDVPRSWRSAQLSAKQIDGLNGRELPADTGNYRFISHGYHPHFYTIRHWPDAGNGYVGPVH